LWLVASRAARADAAPEASTARVRAELWGGDTFSGQGVWLHDPYLVHAVEFEWMLLSHISMGLRVLPLLTYFDRQAIVGAGLGVTNRVYLGRVGSGLYLGPAVCVVAHYDRFEGNSSNVNLLSSLDLGYQFPNARFRIGLKLEHMSNANLAEHNRGWNGISLLIGTTLWRAGD
jgi:hypothetical protein